MAQNAPRNRRLSKSGRAVGLLCAMALVIGASVGHGLPVPDTILLPDSLGPLQPDYHLAFGSSTDNIYVASESSDIIVVDGETFQRIKRINTGTPVGGALLVSQHNKLYCSYPQQGRIGVIDCATNSVVGSILVGTRPKLLCYSSGSDKLYCGDTIDRTVTVIDCATDTVRKVISVGKGLAAMVYDPTTGKVYAATRDALRSISCSTDSVVASLAQIASARHLCVNKRRQKLYITRQYVDTVYAVSTQTDSLVAMTWWGGAGSLACNEVTDRLYCTADAAGEEIAEFDCSGDTYIRRGDIWPYVPGAIACDTVHNRLFCLGQDGDYGSLIELDCASWSPVSNIPVGMFPAVLEVDPARYRVMCAGGRGYDGGYRQLMVFDNKHDTTLAIGAVPLCGWTGAMCHNPAAGRLYCGRYRGLGVIDEQTNRVVDQVFLPEGGGKLIHSRTSYKFYFDVTYNSHGGKHGLGVLDGTKDSLLKVIELGSAYADAFPCWCPDGNKVYAFATSGLRYYVAVVDCYTDSVVRTIDVYDRAKGFEYLGEGRMLCNLRERLTLIDCRTDSILIDSTTIGAVYALAHTGDGEKFYIVRPGLGLEVRSSKSLSLQAAVDWTYGASGSFLVYSDTTRKLYWFVRDSVLAIDTRSDTVTARMTTSAAYKCACLDHTGRYLFCASHFDSTLRVYDTQSDSLVAAYAHLPTPIYYTCPVTPNPNLGCIYVGCRDMILAYSDVPPGVEETPNGEVRMANTGPTVVKGVLFLPEATSRKPQASSLMDATGRKVMELKPGANDVRDLPPGVYFLRERPQAASSKPQAVRKVVITR